MFLKVPEAAFHYLEPSRLRSNEMVFFPFATATFIGFWPQKDLMVLSRVEDVPASVPGNKLLC